MFRLLAQMNRFDRFPIVGFCFKSVANSRECGKPNSQPPIFGGL